MRSTLTGVSWNLSMVVICITWWLMILSIISYFCWPFVFIPLNIPARVFCPFRNYIVLLLLSWVLYMFWILILYQLHCLQIFSTILLDASLLCWVFPFHGKSLLARYNPICLFLSLLPCFWVIFQEVFAYAKVLQCSVLVNLMISGQRLRPWSIFGLFLFCIDFVFI